MFDFGFAELLLVAVISLIVIGPDRLPETVRTVGMWIGRLKRSLRETRREIEQQLGADEIRRQLHNEEIMRNLEKMRSEMETLKQEVRLESELFTDDNEPADKPQAEDGSKPDEAASGTERPTEQKHS